MDQTQTQGKTCPCPHHKMTPILVVLIGVDFLLGAFNILTPETVQIIWPILVIIGGLTKLNEGRCKCC
ncbi:MAG: hypothetical protein A3B25_00650 [Candidatus Ryanbacteria bacterium RIFCSPLOWO2_01_FULL_48_26]|uniref:DUF5668 domain-containing protein n=1 Tax=Candidatus Ryanbacteria bacterium RIFCSPLOWO2_01_FULL_48_26 TaxID=1802126 RepID=A0A1G2GUV9_9BACT|nr:MAG: hypothetical protein A3B25_00650 [Candidatus Ryanbacteria bacterium RIFCSPLOWO2_01_FULL_48_26]